MLLVTGHTWVWGFTVIMPHRRKRRAEVFLFMLSHLTGAGLEPSKTERQGNQLAFLDSAFCLTALNQELWQVQSFVCTSS